MTADATVLRPRILYVDDQQGNLVVFKATFKKYLDVVTASSAKDALALLEKEEFPVVVSDQRMGEMNGTELLAECRKRWPDTARMLLTAYTDFDDVVRAINDGQVTRFIHKPWEREDLLGALMNAAALYYKSKENRQLTEQLLHRERLAAIGQVTSGLVHELGNIAAVLSVAEDIREDMKKGTDVSRELEILQGGIEKFMALVESLRIYSKGGSQLEIVRKPTELGKAISTTLVLLKLFPQVKTLKALTYEPPAESLVMQIDAKKIEQVILNVVKNAAESVPPGTGEVDIRIRPADTDVFIEITDNGPGIPPPAWKKIWEGFYTTKGDKGTGLGLAMCRKIMEAHGGSIAFENLPRGGCTFTLRLPRS
jgi:two-component system, sensor histidine kinase and response regulator